MNSSLELDHSSSDRTSGGLWGATDKFTKNPLLCYYKNLSHETDFILFRSEVGGKRFAWFCFWAALAGAAHGIQQLSIRTGDTLGFRFLGVCGMGLLCEGIMLYYARRVDELPQQRLVFIARARECLCAFVIAYAACDLGVNTRSNNVESVCHWLYTHDERPDHVDCPWRMNAPWFLVLQLPLIIGRPRFVLAALVLLFALLTSFAVLGSRSATTHTKVWWCIFATVYSFFCIVIKFHDERQHRREYELHFITRSETLAVQESEKSLKEFAMNITPRPLRRHLASAADEETHADVSSSAFVVIVDIEDVPKFVTSVLPSQAAVTLSILANECAVRSERCSLTHIRTIGDASVLVGGLFDEPPPLYDVVAYGLDVVKMRPANCDVRCRCGVARGQLMGMPLGSVCVRYDIIGPALSEAQSIAARCPAGRVKVGDDLVAAAYPFAEFAADNVEGGVIEAIKLLSSQDAEEQRRCRSAAHAFPQTPASAGVEDDSTDSSRIYRIAIKRVALDRYTALRDAGDPRQLDVRSSACGVCEEYESRRTAQEQLAHQRRHDVRAFASSCTFSLIFIALMAASVAEERADRFDAFLAATFICLGLAGLGFILLLFSIVLMWGAPTNALQWFHLPCKCAVSLLTMAGAALARPSMIGDDVGFLLLIFSGTLLVSGGSLRQTLVSQSALAAANLALMLCFRANFTLGMTLYTYVSWLAIISSTFLRVRQMQGLYDASVSSKAALAAIHAHRELREGIMRGIAPRQLLPRLQAEAPDTARLDGWGIDDAIVICVQIHGEHQSPISRPPHTGGDPRSIEAQKFAAWAATPQLWLDFAETTLGFIERAVQACRHQTFDIVKVFGGSVIIAGPLDATRPGIGIVQAAEDVMSLLHTLLSATFCFTAAAANEQIINMMRHSQYPTHDIFGTALIISSAIVRAAPAPVTVTTERLAALYLRECAPIPGLELLSPEKWRIRGAPATRVVHLRTTSRRGENLAGTCASSLSTFSGSGSNRASSTSIHKA